MGKISSEFIIFLTRWSIKWLNFRELVHKLCFVKLVRTLKEKHWRQHMLIFTGKLTLSYARMRCRSFPFNYGTWFTTPSTLNYSTSAIGSLIIVLVNKRAGKLSLISFGIFPTCSE